MKKLSYLLGFTLLLFIVATGSTQAATINVPADYATIQAAIDAAAAGDTIIVAAGTYNERLNIQKSLTLLGPNALIDPNVGIRVNEAVIDGSGLAGTDPALNVRAHHVTIQGFEIKNWSGTGVLNRRGYGDGSSGVFWTFFTLMNNYIHDICASSGSAIIIYRSYGGNTITQNLIENVSNPLGVDGSGISDYYDPQVAGPNLISKNVIKNTSYGGILTNGLAATVRDNVIENVREQGIQISGNIGPIDIIGNVIRKTNSRGDDSSGAIRIKASTVMTWNGPVSIQDNLIADSYNGIVITSGLTNVDTKVTVRNNAITGNSPYGVLNYTTINLDARFNWWGDATGPYHSTNLYGLGNPVSNYVLFMPYLAGISYTGDTAYRTTDPWLLKAAVAVGSNPPSPLDNISVSFYVDGVLVGSGVTDNFGIATALLAAQPAGSYSVVAKAWGGASEPTIVTVADSFTIKPSAGSNGTINPLSDQTVSFGGSQTFYFSPNAGYHIAQVLVDGATVLPAPSYYEFINVKADHTIAVSFAETLYPFGSFVIEEAKIDWKNKPDDDKIMVKGSFILPDDSIVNPGDVITFAIGPFHETITVYDVKANEKKWEYHRGKLNGDIKDMKLEFKKDREIKFEFHIDKANLDALSPWNAASVPVSLRIGDDMSSIPITMIPNKKDNKWEYPK